MRRTVMAMALVAALIFTAHAAAVEPEEPHPAFPSWFALAAPLAEDHCMQGPRGENNPLTGPWQVCLAPYIAYNEAIQWTSEREIADIAFGIFRRHELTNSEPVHMALAYGAPWRVQELFAEVPNECPQIPWHGEHAYVAEAQDESLVLDARGGALLGCYHGVASLEGLAGQTELEGAEVQGETELGESEP